MEIADLRNIHRAQVTLVPGLNVFVGRNAQGKTSLLEAMALLARGRSFRTDEVKSLIRTGTRGLLARGRARTEGRATALEVEVTETARRLRVDGREVAPARYHGRLEVVVYSTDRLKVVRGPMRERRQFLDRAGSSLWPAYRQLVRDYERVVQQRNAALEAAGRAQDVWDERLLDLGARLRQRRRGYVARLEASLRTAFRPQGEVYGITVCPGVAGMTESEERSALVQDLEAQRGAERRVRRSLVGPHRDRVSLTIDGRDAAEGASSGQSRSLLLALSLAMLEVYHAEHGQPAVALLDDLDSELDHERATALCHAVAQRGQALVTTAHPGWAGRLVAHGRVFEVEAGRVVAA